MHKHIDTLLQREMTRKEFLATVMFGAATVMGFGSLLKIIKPQQSQSKTSNGYGSNPYGA